MSDWLTWQVVDSAFPTGLFAHSSGLEAAWQHGEVVGVPQLRNFVDATIVQAGSGVLPLVNATFLHPERVYALDTVADAFLTNPVANRASRVHGRTLISTAARVWPTPPLMELKARAATMHAHVAPWSGVVFRELGVPLATTQRVILFGAARGVLSAAVRLGIVGSFEAQRLQSDVAPRLDEVALRSATLDADDLAQTAPILDLLQSAHDRLYSRLFQS
jgi:urease accessory protein